MYEYHSSKLCYNLYKVVIAMFLIRFHFMVIYTKFRIVLRFIRAVVNGKIRDAETPGENHQNIHFADVTQQSNTISAGGHLCF